MVEIGGGPGALTAPLSEKLTQLHVVEIDRELAAALPSRVAHPDRLVVHEADALDFDFDSLATGPHSLRVVGNLPYNISTPLLFRLLEQRAAIRDMHLMLQKEVVDRMVAPPGSRTYGRLTVMLAPWVRIERLLNVGPGAFTPAPQVASAVARITPLAAPAFDIGSAASFDRVVRAAFAHRRKTLRNALKGTVAAGILEQLGIDPGARPETLAAAQYAALARAAG
jgi:16S rRNA (adenine1518-N6/adenine1519-N6)-dimethyltransferase